MKGDRKAEVRLSGRRIEKRAVRRAAQPLRDLPLHIKGLVVVAIPLLGLLAVTIAFYFVQRENQAAERWVSHTLEVRSQIQLVHTRMEEAETGVLGYLQTRDPAWLEPFRQAEKGLPGALDQLESMVADNPGQLRRAREIRSLATQRLRLLAALPRRISAGEPSALAESKLSLQAIEQQLSGMLGYEDKLLGQRREHAAVVWNRGYSVIAAGVLFVPAGAIVAMLLFTAGVARRIQVLEQNAHHLAQGQPISPMRSGNDEIGRLEQSLADAASLLASREHALRQAAGELDNRVRERTAELAAENAERRRAEAELGDANQRLRAVIDASPLAIIGLDLAGNVTGWNQGAERMFGWTAAEAISHPLLCIPDDLKEHFAQQLAGAARGDGLAGLELRCRRKDSTPIDVRLWTAPLRSGGGEPRGIISVAADFTEQRRLEQQFIQAQKMEAVGRLAGGVAHDFNNVITVVAGYGHLLLEGVKDHPELHEAAQEVLNAADRAAGLASQLLAFSRRQVIQPKVVEINALVRNIERMLRRVIGEDVELRTALRPDAGAVRADQGQIEQVLMNLAVNARDAMPEGGKLTIETAPILLDESYARGHAGVLPGPYVMLAVSDTGLGMDAETRSHLFEPFFTTKERGKGTGLGLSTVYGIVRQHGGDVWVYSEPGHGTTFKIYLPQVARAAAANAPQEGPVPSPSGSETILVVEDEQPVRHLVCEILAAQGYRVLEADSGEAALRISEQHHGHIHLLLTDVVMPKMSGRDLAEAMALLRPAMKVLFLSGYTDQVVVEHGVLDSAAAFLQKPFTPDTLARRVREVLDRRARA